MEDYALIGYITSKENKKYVSTSYKAYCNFTDDAQDATRFPIDIVEGVGKWLKARQEKYGGDGVGCKWFIEVIKTTSDETPLY